MLVQHLLFVTMLIQLSATFTLQIADIRPRPSEPQCAAMHPLRQHVTMVLRELKPKHLRIVRSLMRTDMIRGVLRHYNKRANSGTGATLRLAQGGSSLISE
jgi:hypothetical protein